MTEMEDVELSYEAGCLLKGFHRWLALLTLQAVWLMLVPRTMPGTQGSQCTCKQAPEQSREHREAEANPSCYLLTTPEKGN
jgi:hypothetical protein